MIFLASPLHRNANRRCDTWLPFSRSCWLFSVSFSSFYRCYLPLYDCFASLNRCFLLFYGCFTPFNRCYLPLYGCFMPFNHCYLPFYRSFVSFNGFYLPRYRPYYTQRRHWRKRKPLRQAQGRL